MAILIKPAVIMQKSRSSLSLKRPGIHHDKD